MTDFHYKTYDSRFSILAGTIQMFSSTKKYYFYACKFYLILTTALIDGPKEKTTFCTCPCR